MYHAIKLTYAQNVCTICNNKAYFKEYECIYHNRVKDDIYHVNNNKTLGL